jgi:hypothetical protein
MKIVHKFIAAITLLVASVFLLRFNGWFSLGAVAALPLVILYWFDLGRELRNSSSSSRTGRTVGFLMGVPQALFGILCLAMGVLLIGWVLYNSLWQRDSHYSGGFLTFGIGPMLALFGFGLVFDAFKKNR